MDDLQTGGILPVVYSRNCPATWSTSVHSIGQGSQVYGTLLEEFPEGHGDIVNDEHHFSSTDRWLVGEDHTVLEDMLRACFQDLKGSREEHLPLVEFSYNNSYQASIQMAPYEVLYGRPYRSPICWTTMGERSITGPNLIRDTSEKVGLIRKRLLTAQSRQKSYADRRRQPLEFEVGDHVFLKVIPKRGVVRFGKRGKLASRYIRSVKILEMVGTVAYRLALPTILSGVHEVFHVSMLRTYTPNPAHVVD